MSSLFALFGSALFFMALLFALLQVKRWKKYWPLAYILVSILLVVPLGHWLTIEFVRSYVSDLSMATLFMCGLYVWQVAKLSAQKVQLSLHWFVIIVSVVLFPMSMGMTQFDPFAMGFSSNAFYHSLLIVMAVIGLVSWFSGFQHIAVVITLALLAHGLQLYEGQNLWVYLVDPIAVIMCFVSIVFKGGRLMFNRIQTVGVKNV